MKKEKIIDELLEMCYFGHLDQVKRLILQGVDINGIGLNGMFPLSAAVDGENLEIVEFLINNGADVNNGEKTILHELFDYAIDDMIQNSADRPNPTDLKMIELIVEKGGDIEQKDKDGERPLDSLNTYATNLHTFNHLKEIFRPIIKDIDDRIKYKNTKHNKDYIA